MAQSTRWWKHLLQSNKRIAPAVKIEIPPLSHVEIKIKILTIVLPVPPIGGIKNVNLTTSYIAMVARYFQ